MILDLVRLRAVGLVPDLSAVNLDLHNVVLPALRRVIGAGLTLPDQITVTADGVYNGVVNATSDKEGRIVAVGDTRVGVSGSREQVRWVLGHELAHHHDLTTRMRNGVAVGHIGATVLWSEYYAQRVVHAAGLACDLGLDAATSSTSPGGGGDSTDAVVPGPGPDHRGQVGYVLSWLKAHRDHDPTAWEPTGISEDKVKYLRTVLGFSDAYDVNGAYRRFPNWTDHDLVTVRVVFGGMADHKIARPRRGTRRRTSTATQED